MAAISQQLTDITVLSIVVRILLSTFCAGTLGFERERHNQAAGFRTYIIVSDASALVMMTNIFVAGIGETDLVRMSASVITWLGFLGAGTILVTRLTICHFRWVDQDQTIRSDPEMAVTDPDRQC